MLLKEDPDGSCDKSGIESQRMRRSLEEGPDDTAAHTFDAITSELAAVDVESREAFVDGRAVNVDGPEKFTPGYKASPGSRARLRGNENEEELAFAKPGDSERDADEDVRRA